MKNFTDLQATIKQHTPSVPEITEDAIIEAEEWVLGFDFKVDNSSTEGRAIQNDLRTKFKKIYSGSGSGGEGFDVSFQGPKKEIDKAKKYVESKYKKNINPKFTNLYLDEGFEVTEIESVETIEEAMSGDKLLGIFNKLKNKDTVEIKYDDASRKGRDYHKFVVTSGKRTVGKARVERIILKSVDNLRGVAYTLYNRKGNVSLAIGDMAASIVDIKESVELDEAWTADSVTKNAEIGSKKGYGINIKKTGGVTKTPHKHMLMTVQKHGNVRVTFDHGKDEFEGTPKSVALYINKKLGIKESVELDEVMSDREMERFTQAHTALHTRYHKQALQIIKFIDSVAKHKDKWTDSFGDYVNAKLPKQLKISSAAGVEYQQGRGRGDWSFLIQHDMVRYNNSNMPWMPKSGELKFDKFMKLLDTWKKETLRESVELGEATKWKMGDGRPRGGSRIENVRFWDLPKDELEYIIKDAGEAMRANPKARKATTGPGNWADQVNDASTVLGWRKKNGIKESVQLDEKTEAFYKEVHAELKKVMDKKYYREFQSSNGGQALNNVINHMGKSRGWRVDKTVKSIIDKYGRNQDEYVKLSFQSAAKGRIREEVELGEGTAWDAILRIKDQMTAEKVHGTLVDMQTAKLLCDVMYALNKGNQKKFMAAIDKNAMGLKKMVDFAWKQVK